MDCIPVTGIQIPLNSMWTGSIPALSYHFISWVLDKCTSTFIYFFAKISTCSTVMLRLKAPLLLNAPSPFHYFLINALSKIRPQPEEAFIRCGLSLAVDGTEDDFISISSIQYHRGRWCWRWYWHLIYLIYVFFIDV